MIEDRAVIRLPAMAAASDPESVVPEATAEWRLPARAAVCLLPSDAAATRFQAGHRQCPVSLEKVDGVLKIAEQPNS